MEQLHKVKSTGRRGGPELCRPTGFRGRSWRHRLRCPPSFCAGHLCGVEKNSGPRGPKFKWVELKFVHLWGRKCVLSFSQPSVNHTLINFVGLPWTYKHTKSHNRTKTWTTNPPPRVLDDSAVHNAKGTTLWWNRDEVISIPSFQHLFLEWWSFYLFW